MTDDHSTLASILTVARYLASRAGSALVTDSLVYALWTAVFALAGGMMLFLLTVPHAVL